jgi:hypothetical protein
MNQQYYSKAVQSRADNQKVVSGSHCQLIDKATPKNSFQFCTISVLDALDKHYSILLTGGVA